MRPVRLPASPNHAARSTRCHLARCLGALVHVADSAPSEPAADLTGNYIRKFLHHMDLE